jgi:hypothetical protein
MSYYKLPQTPEGFYYCSSCEKNTQHKAYDLGAIQVVRGLRPRREEVPLADAAHYALAVCQENQCGKISIWYDNELSFPLFFVSSDASLNRFPPEIRPLYRSAFTLQLLEPQVASFLLRKALRIVLKQLGCPGNNLAEDIAYLEKERQIPTMGDALRNDCLTNGRDSYPPHMSNYDTGYHAILLLQAFHEIIQ